MSETTYDILKWIGRIVLPALATLYATVGKIWGFPYTNEIPLTITALDLFLNTLLGISSENYNSTVIEWEDKEAQTDVKVEDEEGLG